MASALCSRAMRAQGMSVGTSEKRVWYSARRLSFSVLRELGSYVRSGEKERGMARRTSLSIFYVPNLRWRWNGCCTVLLYVLQEIDEILFGLVRFDEQKRAIVQLDNAVCVTRFIFE
jgi:hypothetical protein